MLQRIWEYFRAKQRTRIRNYARSLKGVDNLGRMRYLIAQFPHVIRVTTEEALWSSCSIYLDNGYVFRGGDVWAINAARKAAADYLMYLWRGLSCDFSTR